MATTDQLVGAYIKLRDQKKELADRHKQEMKPFNERMAIIENALLDRLNTSGADSVKCATGTASRVNRTNIKTEDWDVTLAFIKKNDLFHMLTKALAKESVKEYIEANGEPPPGVGVSIHSTIGVWRPTK